MNCTYELRCFGVNEICGRLPVNHTSSLNGQNTYRIEIVVHSRVGLRLPLSASGRGGLSLGAGEAHDRTIILAAIKGGGNSNPFQQDIDHQEAYLYEVDDERIEALVKSHLVNVFAQFEAQHRYRLVPESIVIRDGENIGTREVLIEYVHVESSEFRTLSLAL